MRYIDHIIGVVKAYSTRVGGGPFPTELDNELGQYMRDRGNEYGTVTRRPRRCGWLDAVALRYTARLSGVDAIAVMLLDVLSGLEELKICTAYEIDGKQITHFPSHVDDIRRVKPVYETLPGWAEEITALPHDGRVAGKCPGVSRPDRRAGGSADRDGLRRPGTRSDDRRQQVVSHDGQRRTIADRATSRPSGGRGTSRSSWTATAAGRSGQNLPRVAGHQRGVDSRPPHDRRVLPGSRSSSSRSIACPAKTGSGRRPRSTS